MHTWGDGNVDWDGLNDAARYIATRLKKYGRIQVMQYKEKFGTVRVYCSFGVTGLYWLVNPGHAYYKWPKRWKWTTFGMRKFWDIVSRVLAPWQKFVYRRTYENAVRRWPHLVCEICHGADWYELLDGLCPHKNCGWKKVGE